MYHRSTQHAPCEIIQVTWLSLSPVLIIPSCSRLTNFRFVQGEMGLAEHSVSLQPLFQIETSRVSLISNTETMTIFPFCGCFLSPGEIFSYLEVLRPGGE